MKRKAVIMAMIMCDDGTDSWGAGTVLAQAEGETQQMRSKKARYFFRQQMLHSQKGKALAG